MRKAALLITIGLTLLSYGCGNKKVVKVTPPWFFEPGRPHFPGSVGFSNPCITEKKAFQLAKKRALQSLCTTLNINCKTAIKSLKNKKPVKLKNKKVTFLTYKYKNDRFVAGEIYAAFAGLKKPTPPFKYYKDCKNPSLQKCKPKWLCNYEIEGYAGAVGISNISSNFFDEYLYAVRDAVEKLALMYGISVNGTEIRKSIRTPLGAYKLSIKDFSFKATDHPKINFLVRSMFVDKKGRLFVYVITPNIKKKPYPTINGKPCWLIDPFCLKSKGYIYIGSAGENIFGIKAQIKKAIENALIQMAKSKGVEIDTERVTVRLNNARWISLFTKENTTEVVKGELIGIYFSPSGTVFAGIAELKKP
ncbi:hypothetical protein [Desulfurobacterium indicum]|uniref:Lipoprotein n=1 Tax=Desulfurobacterium indicum TaxID=1914305 RepID=A0A1R1MJY7_9BACT|nr:hypothetical protein [Desulfurobacterium indicum]OMH40076.1 hypothetical protein BLW93_07070 [Desulfurobacterium indicum]